MSSNGTYENKRIISKVSICEIVEEYKRTNTQETRSYLREIMQIPARNVRHVIKKVLCTANTVFYCNRQQKVSVGMTTNLVFNTRVTYIL